MDRIIYADSLFVINFCVDFLALKVSAVICHANCKLLQLATGALVGALYSVASAYFDVKGVFALLCGLAAALLMCFVTFDFRDLKNLVRVSGTFFAVNVAFGGTVAAVQNLICMGQKPGIKTIIAWSALCAAAIVKSVENFKQKSVKKLVDCSITLCGEQKNLTLLCDSGNVLKDPFNGKSVIVVSAKCFRKMAELVDAGRLECLCKASPRIIPINTAGGKTLLYGFKAENITVTQWPDTQNSAPLYVDATVALDFANESFDGADGIIPPSLVI